MDAPIEPVASHEAENGIAFSSAWAPDSSRLAVAGLGDGIRILDSDAGNLEREIHIDTNWRRTSNEMVSHEHRTNMYDVLNKPAGPWRHEFDTC